MLVDVVGVVGVEGGLDDDVDDESVVVEEEWDVSLPLSDEDCGQCCQGVTEARNRPATEPRGEAIPVDNSPCRACVEKLVCPSLWRR